MLDVMLAGLCDPARFRRGRDYARQGAVADLVVTSGVATANVQGSRPQAYVVTIRATPVAAEFNADKLTALVPSRNEVQFDCDCPDWESPCKHAVAVMAHLSERIAYEPTLLTTWRSGHSAGSAARAKVGSRAGAAARENAPTAPRLDADARAALDTFLGTAQPLTPPRLGSAPPAPDPWDEPWAFMLTDALSALAKPPR